MSRVLVVVLLLGLCPASISAAGTEIAAMKEKLAERMPTIPLDGLRHSKTLPGWYELEHGMQLLFISADARHLFVGDLVDLDAQTNLTQVWREGKALAFVDAVGEENMIVMGPKHAKRTITVFTDVDCPYCAKLHRDVPELVESGVKVRYLLFPRNGLASETYRRSVAVWCADDRVRAVGTAKSGGKLDMKTCPNPVAEHHRLGQTLRVRGTPTIYLDDGKVLGGYVPSERLLAILGLTPGDKTSDAR